MKIKANSIEDFKKQYYQQCDGNSPMDLNIELETDDTLWKEITKVSYNNSVQSLNFMGVTPPDFERVKQFFVPEYGNIKRLENE